MFVARIIAVDGELVGFYGLVPILHCELLKDICTMIEFQLQLNSHSYYYSYIYLRPWSRNCIRYDVAFENMELP